VSVYLVGAGPGDADLLTLRAAHLLAVADVVVHDRLVGASVLELIAPCALRIDVGKTPGLSSSQTDINDLLIELATHYQIVVRLKGGDPFVFGRGGEEAIALSARGIDVHAGIPVTHRGVAHGVCVVTATAEGGRPVDFERLANPDITLVVLMGVARRGDIAEQLRRGGLDAATPVAVVQSAASLEQSVVRGRLDELARFEVVSPAVIVVGPVAGLDLGLMEVVADLVGAS